MQIHYYLFKRVCRFSFSITATLTLIILTVQIIALDELLIYGTANFLQLLLLAGLATSEFIAFLLIISFATSIYIVRQQVANDNELIVIQATGISPRQLLKPYYQMVFVVMLCSYGLTLGLVPELLYLQKQKLNELRDQAVSSNLRSKRFFTPEPKLHFYVGDIDFTNSTIYDIYIADYRQSPSYFLTAKQGQFFNSAQGVKIKFTEGSYHYIQSNGKGSENELNDLQFQEFWYDISDFGNKTQSKENIKRKVKALPTPILLRKLVAKDAEENPQLTAKYQGELQMRMNIPLMSASLAGFLLQLSVSPVTRRHKRMAKQYGIILGVIMLIVIQVVFINVAVGSGGIFGTLMIFSYVLPMLLLGLPLLKTRHYA